MFKKIIYIILIFLLTLFLLTSCLHRDYPEQPENTEATEGFYQQVKEVGNFQTVLIDGREYLQARGEVGKYGGALLSSSIGEGPKTFNPWNAKDSTSSEFGSIMFDGLTTIDSYTGKIVPKMAKEIEILPDKKNYIVTLRKGLKWSDGKEITSDDVVFTYNTIVKEGYGNTSMRDVLLVEGEFPKVEKLDKYRVKFTTPKPFAPFLMQLSTPIAPKHVLEKITNQDKKVFDSFWGVTTPPEEFVTSGMFRLEEYIPAQRVQFKRNPDYYMVDKAQNKLPYLDKYIVFIVGDINNQILKFEAGEIDLLSVKGSSVAKFKQKEKNSDYKMFNLGAAESSNFFFFNLNQRKDENGKPYVDPIKQEWFNDINFRTAIDYALDRNSMVFNVLNGVGLPLFTAESLTSVFLNEKLKNGHPQNIEYAKELLAKSGFKLDSKNRLRDKHGNLVQFTLLTNAGNTERESVGVIIKEDLEKLGVKVDFKPIEFNVLVGKLNSTYDWEAAVLGLTGGSPFEPNMSVNVWKSTGGLHLFNQRAGKDLETKAMITPYEEKLDEIFVKGAVELDFDKRKEIYDEYQQIVYDERPLIYLYTNLKIFAIREKFGNINPTPLGGMVHNLEEVYIK